MCTLNKDQHFHNSDYSLILHLHDAGGISGFFRPVNDYLSMKEYPVKGCYHVPKPEVAELAFTIDWSPYADNECNFTCFSGQLSNQNILILNWILISQKEQGNCSVNGSAFLYPSLQHGMTQKMHPSVKPFPANIRLIET